MSSESPATMRVARYTRMEEGTAEDFALTAELAKPFLASTADRVLAYLPQLQNSYEGTQVDRYEHSLQAASRALRDGADDELVVAALLHDIGDLLAPENHAEYAAAILQPFVSTTTCWIVRHHAIFQGYYYFHFAGRDRNARDQYRGHPAYVQTAEFCARWDQASFDPDYNTLPLKNFEPIVRRVFSRPPWSAAGSAV